MKIERYSKGLTVISLTTALWSLGLPVAPAAPASDARAQTPCGRGDGMGPGMMGGGYGRGMMGGYGMGPGMMRGDGMGPGMMMGFGGWPSGLDLTSEQRAKINRIQDDTRKAHWALMGDMMDQQAKLRDLYDAPKRDGAAIDETSRAIGSLRQKMIDASVDTRKKMEAVLTSKQLDKLRAYEKQADDMSW
ncbi:Spy/CpxP family protein refolding chaperone [Burkholderia pseudomallei]|uniref:Spy/CpxP family protein refolding chaperone n=1 Tax=Burkholderia pseudomallei TaxID=28450 RepID=UPI0019FB1D03|nr:Spy/CpxP family protein refolding chaperone [Burkholderia pseudomallei]MBF3439865.1 Spy/CpxP family protein refolding chaperone [Burkholderia pseudomallei]MBF3464450.1 Spy/CpxP family protein refolding chaperone [Burkholderia pseudomallei]MBF3828196.1 Spy/CpxP family protein refolding chaperone [Burkholderia pseudomallei]